MSKASSNRRKVLVPLATLLAAGAIAVGSGASFTSQTTNSGNSYTAGKLAQSNDVSGALFNLDNLKPGDVITKDVTITNSGSLPAAMALSGTASNGFAHKNYLTLTVTDGGKAIVAKTALADLAKVALPSNSTATAPVPAWEPKEQHTYSFSVALDKAADNTDQGKTATASFTWDGTQENGKTFSGTVTDNQKVNTVAGADNG